jgi:thioredoxin 2
MDNCARQPIPDEAMTTAAHLTADDRGIVLNCPQCHRANRIPFGRVHQAGHCGSCKAALPHASLPVEIESAAAFDALIRGASLPVLVDFWAPWCGPCQMVAPEVAKLAALAAGELLVVKVNTEALPDLAGSMGIRSIPTFAVFNAGREVERALGAMSATDLRAFTLRAVK